MQPDELSPDELSALLTSFVPEIPGYRVMRRIGKGGMSHVYLGVQESLDRQVAIKVMSPEALTDEKSKQRFEQEARTIAKLEHPCIVGIHEVGRTPQGLLYYVLPYLAKGHLGQRDFTGDEARIVEVLRALLSALEYAHARGIVHRDVKAENVLFDNADRPLLTDFGIALSKRDTSRITTAGLAVGSGGYMAPEQARGEVVDGRADLYSVGVLAYELLTGRLPYLSSDPLALALMHAQDPIPRLPPEKKNWQAFIDRAMAKAPDNRFRNAQQMLGALGQIQIGAAAATDGTVATTGGLPGAWRKPVLFGAAGLTLVLVATLALRSGGGHPGAAKTDFFAGSEGGETPKVAAAGDQPAAPTAAPNGTDPGVAPTTGATPAPPVAESPAVAPAAMPDAPASAPATPTAAGASVSPFTQVIASATVTPLDYDPGVPGSRELAAARRQIAHNRLSTPPGDSAVDSLQAARKLAPTDPALPGLADQVLAGLAKSLSESVKAGRDDAAKSGYQRAKAFARDLDRLDGPAWKSLRAALPPLLVARLEKATAAFDAAAINRTKTLAGVLEVDAKLLEPAWSKADALPKPGDVVRSNGPSVVVVSPTLAFMREEVTRSSYAEFVSATNRATARCRNRLAPITIKKRTWSDPGFAQSGSHPVVCVSYEDARAYAQWLSQRTGDSYRLPSAAEWRQINSYRGSGDACRDGQVGCGGTSGTVPAAQGPASPMGLMGVRGNVREWLSDCEGGCQRHLVAGLGWRDSATRAEPQRTSGFDAGTGFDDTGFRLVRELGR